jgi:hypothetical protein
MKPCLDCGGELELNFKYLGAICQQCGMVWTVESYEQRATILYWREKLKKRERKMSV